MKSKENAKPKKKLSKKIKILLAVLLLLILSVAALLAIFQAKRNKMLKNMESSFTVETAKIERQTLTNAISATGTIESAETKTVNTKLSNLEVVAVYVKEGDYVEEGTVICEFDSSDYKEELAKAQNNHSINQKLNNLGDDYTTVYEETIAEAEENLEAIREIRDEAKDAYNESKNVLGTAQAAYEKAKANYNPESPSADDPAAEADPAKKAYEEAKTAYEAALADSEQKKVTYEQAQAKREEFQESYEATVEKAQYDYDKAVLESQLITESQEERTIGEYTDLIEECVVKADMSGVITSLNVTQGNNFEGGNIYTIQDNDHFIVSATVDEYDISSIEKGMSAYIKTDATGDVEMSGEVTYVAIAPTSTGGAMGAVSSSASYRIEVTIADPDENLRAGMTAKLSISLEEAKDVLTVPYDAVTSMPGGNATITIDEDGEKKTISVKTGLETDYYTEIISDEISEGMTVYLTTPMISVNPSGEDEMGFPGGMMPGGMPDFENMPGGGSMPGRGGSGRGDMPSGMPGGGMPSGGPGGGF